MNGKVAPALTAVVAAALLASSAAVAAPHARYAKKPAATTYRLKTTLDAAREVPRPRIPAAARHATGSFTATLTLLGKTGTLAWHLTFAHLGSPSTAAHVHLGAPGKAGPVAIPLCGPCKSGAHGTFKGAIGGNAKLLHALLHGGAYVNVHTKLNPAGEIRGQVAARLVKRA